MNTEKNNINFKNKEKNCPKKQRTRIGVKTTKQHTFMTSFFSVFFFVLKKKKLLFFQEPLLSANGLTK